ncbi:hypothetical protein Ciccas_001819 [Cichlidogyrus casuarinus]|uniref:Choline O-acetyltransferase n=1 Tax=Cichlidogyrus casuarinus TaxID=1844966 RepID=A0ABD2QJ19_9PLAT
MLRKAMDWQTEVMLENILGYGVDNHLLGLRQTAVESGEALPEIFQDRIYSESNQFRLSTSQVPTTSDSVMCYGAVVNDGYGAAYNPHPDYIVIVVSSWHNCSITNSAKFATNLQEALREMKELVLSNPELAKTKATEPLEWRIPEETTSSVTE